MNSHNSPEVLDPLALRDLAQAVGDDYVPTLLRAFREDLEKLWRKASVAADESDVVSFGQAMHSLNGSSAYCGATRLATLVSDCRYLSFTTQAELRAAMTELEPVLDATAKALANINLGESQ